MYWYNVSTTKVFVSYKTVVYHTKIFVVETLYHSIYIVPREMLKINTDMFNYAIGVKRTSGDF